MKRQFRGRTDAFVRSDNGEQGFWPSYADMMAAVALILFFVMMLSYIQNLITGNKLENTQAALADTEERLTATQTLLDNTRTLLEETKLELESTQAELQSTKTDLQSTKTQLATTRSELNEKREEVRTTEAQLAQIAAELTETSQALSQKQTELSQKQTELSQKQAELSQKQLELNTQDQQLSAQNAQIAAQEARLAAANAELEDMRRQMNALAVLRYDIVKQIRDSMVATMGDASKVAIGESGNLILNESILFDSGKWEIKPEAEPALDLLIDVFYHFLSDENNRSYVESIIISGHTDAEPFKDGNQVLSTNRANAVLGYLLEGKNGKLSVYANYFCAAGYGETRPVASNDTPTGRAANRRIEISILLKDESIMALVESLAGN